MCLRGTAVVIQAVELRVHPSYVVAGRAAQSPAPRFLDQVVVSGLKISIHVATIFGGRAVVVTDDHVLDDDLAGRLSDGVEPACVPLTPRPVDRDGRAIQSRVVIRIDAATPGGPIVTASPGPVPAHGPVSADGAIDHSQGSANVRDSSTKAITAVGS